MSSPSATAHLSSQFGWPFATFPVFYVYLKHLLDPVYQEQSSSFLGKQCSIRTRTDFGWPIVLLLVMLKTFRKLILMKFSCVFWKETVPFARSVFHVQKTFHLVLCFLLTNFTAKYDLLKACNTSFLRNNNAFVIHSTASLNKLVCAFTCHHFQLFVHS